MNLSQAYRASEALAALAHNEGMNAREAYGVMKLTRAFRDDANFYAQKRNELLERHGTRDAQDASRFHFATKSCMEAFTEKLRELDETESSARVEPVVLRGDIVGVTPDMLDALFELVRIE